MPGRSAARPNRRRLSFTVFDNYKTYVKAEIVAWAVVYREIIIFAFICALLFICTFRVNF
jgi:NADH:ubiquinone oxidoreductase subunit 3 (subunit A)